MSDAAMLAFDGVGGSLLLCPYGQVELRRAAETRLQNLAVLLEEAKETLTTPSAHFTVTGVETLRRLEETLAATVEGMAISAGQVGV